MATKAVKKNKKKLNIIDIVIILLVIALVTAVCYRIFSKITGNASSRQSGQMMTFECEVEYGNTLKYLENGAKVYLESDGSFLGYLYDVNERSAGTDNSGTDTSSLSDFTKNIKLDGSIRLSEDVLKLQGENYYVIKGRIISVGSVLSVYTEKAVLNITVKSLDSNSQK